MEDLTTLVNYDLIIAALLGAAIGFEREISGKDPGLRTFSLICVGSCAFSMLSVYSHTGFQSPDSARIAAQVVSGIGFLGAGAIFRSKRGISGLTTAALMWITASIGMAVAFSRYDIAVSTTIISLLITLLLRVVHLLIRRIRRRGLDQSALELA